MPVAHKLKTMELIQIYFIFFIKWQLQQIFLHFFCVFPSKFSLMDPDSDPQPWKKYKLKK